jgi:hypothetical protein
MNLNVAISSYLKNDVSLLEILGSCLDSKLIAFDIVSEGLKKTYNARLAICAECPIFVNGHCGDGLTTELVRDDGTIYKGCGCLMTCKASKKHNFCGAGKW